MYVFHLFAVFNYECLWLVGEDLDYLLKYKASDLAAYLWVVLRVTVRKCRSGLTDNIILYVQVRCCLQPTTRIRECLRMVRDSCCSEALVTTMLQTPLFLASHFVYVMYIIMLSVITMAYTFMPQKCSFLQQTFFRGLLQHIKMIHCSFLCKLMLL